MAEEAEVKGKKKTEITIVKMTDGREVGFAGKRKLVKNTLIDESKIMLDGDTVTFGKDAVSVRLDFRNGETRTYPLPLGLVAKFAGHGGEQKFGDELAAPADKPLSEADMVVAVDDLFAQIAGGDWSAVREGGAGGFSGASVVIRAIMEASGKSMEDVKAFLQKKLDASKASAEAAGTKPLSRKDLYDSFRNPNSKTGQIIERLEREERAKNTKVDADAALAELGA